MKNKLKKLNDWIATVIIQSNRKYTNKTRFDDLSKVINNVIERTEGDGVILFPGGFFNAGKQKAKKSYEPVKKKIQTILKKVKRNIVICLGIDGRGVKCAKSKSAKDQIAIAINKKGIEAIGRKFYPAPKKNGVKPAKEDPNAKEDDKNRYFELNKKKYFLCVCYDIFGIKKKKIQNSGDVILDLVHYFYPKGEVFSSESNFARHGFAGASNQWGCPVFAATVFFKEIPRCWPSGVNWVKGKTNKPSCTYNSIAIEPIKETCFIISEGIALVRIYNLKV